MCVCGGGGVVKLGACIAMWFLVPFLVFMQQLTAIQWDLYHIPCFILFSAPAKPHTHKTYDL